MADENICDVIVVGSGAGGLGTAVTAALKGLTVVVLEKAPVYGGTSAISGGGTWIPCNPVAKRAGLSDSREAARSYFQHSAGNRFDAARVDAFLDKAPEMVTFLEQQAGLPFTVQPDRPDYHPDVPGASRGGRVIYAAPFDARALGKEVARLRPPLKELTLLGIMIRPGPDLKHFINVFRSFESFKVVTRRLLRHVRDVLTRGRSMDLGNGNALIARLATIAFGKGVEIRTSVDVRDLILENGRVSGVKYERADGTTGTLHARRGVVLAAGGFPHDVARRKEVMSHAPTGHEHKSATVNSNTGDGIRMAERIGAVFNSDLSDAASWAPVSLVPQRGGKPVPFPHLIDRQKPGFIAVTRRGRRFVNESDSYHDFVRGLVKASANDPPPECFLIADHRTIRRYGIGCVKPAPVPMFHHVRSGYLMRGNTLAELAQQAGIEAEGFLHTVEEFNKHARLGNDPEFNRGGNSYNRYNGDALHKPNPCVAPIEVAPFYAVKIYAGDLGTFAGLKTDEHARVLDAAGQPIAGLYAVGNDMSHIMSGEYMSGGTNLGPALTFGYIAACDLAASTAVTTDGRDSAGTSPSPEK